MSIEAIAQPSSEEALDIGIEEDVNSFTCDYMSRPSPEGHNKAVEPTNDDVLLKIGPFTHVIELNLVICLDCKTGILARQVKAHLVDPLSLIVMVNWPIHLFFIWEFSATLSCHG
jgi:hypothetical protein